VKTSYVELYWHEFGFWHVARLLADFVTCLDSQREI